MKSKTRRKKNKAKAGIKIKSGKPDFPVAVIGASAGGLEAIIQFLKAIPPDTGTAFVCLQHLSPDYKSLLASLLSKHTKMNVVEARNGIKLNPDTFYLIPPGKGSYLLDSGPRLVLPEKNTHYHLPIDDLFSSAAANYNNLVIGIILSGCASDGKYGMTAIKHAGGITFAQDRTAKFNSMPQSVINEGVVDFILPPDRIAHELARLVGGKKTRDDFNGVADEKTYENYKKTLKIIYQLLENSTGVDFSQYKTPTIRRRIARRMLLCKTRTLKEYAALLGKKNDEKDQLYQDLLINVTSFFRDSSSFVYLKTNVFPKLLKNKTTGEALRIWVPACSTGEEAYSLAVILLELQKEKFANIPVQIFATDLNERAIHKSRTGEYSKSEIDNISPKRLQRFYNKSNGVYRIAKAVRNMCVFAPHNILRDPPFSKIDFISCCNLLIYLDAAAQKKITTMFHYSLRENGLLMLGKSESTGAASHLFTQANRKYKIYRRKNTRAQRPVDGFVFRFQKSQVPEKEISGKNKKHPVLYAGNLNKTLDAVLLSEYVPASVVITHDMEIIQFRGATSLYLEHPPGKASLNILKMTPPEIALELRMVVQNAIKMKQKVRKTGIPCRIGSTSRIICLEAVPFKLEWDEPLLLVVFSDQEQPDPQLRYGKGLKTIAAVKDQKIKKLEEELTTAYANMRSLNEEQEAINEELQSSNEEIISSNEELQSVNEELETFKEEIESANEELISTNQELRIKNEQLMEAHAYAEAVVDTIREPLIILDRYFRVKYANKAFYKKFNLIEEETEGVSFFELNNQVWNIPSLRNLLDSVSSKNTNFYDFEIRQTFPGIGEKIMLLNARCMPKQNHAEQLILLSVEDFTELFFQRLKKQNVELEKIVSERTIELKYANESLENKNEQLRKMNNELVSFAYVASHDLQEPLRKIQTFITRIIEKEKESVSAAGIADLEAIRESALQMQVLIEELLAYSKTNTMPKTFIKTDIGRVIEEIKKGFRDVIEKKKAVIESGKQNVITVIPLQFHQMMKSVIDNALKFSRPGKPPRIVIQSTVAAGSTFNNKKLLPERQYCRISVTDNGIGFDPKYGERIFQVFQRLHAKEKYPGAGIGLSISRKIAELHGGIITATGDPNKGATFEIYLPSDHPVSPS